MLEHKQSIRFGKDYTIYYSKAISLTVTFTALKVKTRQWLTSYTTLTWTFCRTWQLTWIMKAVTCSWMQLQTNYGIQTFTHITSVVRSFIFSMKPIRKQFKWVLLKFPSWNSLTEIPYRFRSKLRVSCSSVWLWIDLIHGVCSSHSSSSSKIPRTSSGITTLFIALQKLKSKLTFHRAFTLESLFIFSLASGCLNQLLARAWWRPNRIRNLHSRRQARRNFKSATEIGVKAKAIMLLVYFPFLFYFSS